MKGKNLLTALLLSVYSNVLYAQQNNVYVDQIGAGSTINFTQTGSGNAIGNATTKAIINGGNNLVSMSQIGNTNINVLNVQGSGVIISSTVTGDSNNITVLCGTSGDCSSSNIANTVTGDGNTVEQNSDTAIVSTVNITSDNNTVIIKNTATAVSPSKSNVDISGGGGNQVDILQAGAAGANGHDASIVIVGATNNVDIRQGGSVDSKVISTITGSGNALTIKSNHQ
jgi:hypothetical protein